MAINDRLRKAWNAFRNTSEYDSSIEYGGGVSYGIAPPSRARLPLYNDKSIIGAIYNRMGIDVADIVYRHVKVDEQNRFQEDMGTHLNTCLTFEPNIDQGPREFRQDLVMTLFLRGVAAIVPVDTTIDPTTNEIFDIYSLRVGDIVKWLPKHVRVSVWNEAEGKREEVTLEKRFVTIVQNPLYMVMNEPSSTLQRLIRKLSLLDAVDEATSSGKLDIIIQLPYTIRSEARKLQAEKRRDEIEFQLKSSQYGIAYSDATEKVVQLNRPVENKLLAQIEFLTNMLYGQLGITEAVMNGTADEGTMINYYNRTIKPIVDSVVEAMQRAFLGFNGRARGERIVYFRDPFKFVSAKDLAEIVDKFTRNEVFAANEIRGFMGVPPSKDPKADKLINSNMPVGDTGVVVQV